jgi:anti-anti-sigma regulatory factor
MTQGKEQTMEINVVAVVQLHGAMNGKKLVAEAQKLYDAGAQNLVLDMSGLTFISSAGLSALHHIALVYRGEERPTFTEDRAAIHAMREEGGGGFQFQEHVKLFNPSEAIQDVLDIVGFKAFFEIFTDLDAAIASFQKINAPG